MKITDQHFGAFIHAALILALFINSSAISQGFGIKAGVSLSDQSYDNGITNSELDRLNQYGFSAGIFLSHKIGFLSEVRFEVDFIQKGSGIEVLLTNENFLDRYELITINDRINYISFNLLATPSLLNSSEVAPYLIIGPRIDVLAGYTSDFNSSLIDDFNSTVLGATIGAGIILNSNSSIPILLEVIYNLDFSNAFEQHYFSYAFEQRLFTIRNNSIQMMAGFSF